MRALADEVEQASRGDTHAQPSGYRRRQRLKFSFTLGEGDTQRRKGLMEPLPDLATLTDEDLKKLIDELTQEEHEVSYRRRLLHGKIDILRAELVARLQQTQGRSVLDSVDVESLTEILTGKPRRLPDGARLLPGVRHNNPIGVSQRCGAALSFLRRESTEALTPRSWATAWTRSKTRGTAALTSRRGGRAGETFLASPTTIGRSPDCAIFLDVVTVAQARCLQRGRRPLAAR